MNALAFRAAIDELQVWMKRAQNAIAALQELEELREIVSSAKKPDKPTRGSKPRGGGGTKTCSHCNEDKPIADFPAVGRQCKSCRREYGRQHYREAHPKSGKRSAGPLPFSCELCHCKFSTEEALELHQEMKHEKD
jgi:hypothetical protein